LNTRLYLSFTSVILDLYADLDFPLLLIVIGGCLVTTACFNRLSANDLSPLGGSSIRVWFQFFRLGSLAAHNDVFVN
jgi:hypothetical protein